MLCFIIGQYNCNTIVFNFSRHFIACEQFLFDSVSYTHLDVYKRQVLLWAMESSFERSMLCVWGEICSNNACDLNCVCSFRMLFLFVPTQTGDCLLYTSRCV